MAKKKRVTKKKVRRRAAQAKKGNGHGFTRGAAGRKKVDQEIAHQKERAERSKAARDDGPFRLYLKPGTTEREVVILDEEPEFFKYEHQIYNQGRRDLPMYTYTNCVKEWETCPACEADKESYWGLFLTVLDLQPYKTRKKETVEFSRKLMLVKPQQQKKFIRRWKKEGTLRGQTLLLSRDNDKDPVIGNDIEFEGWMDEDDLGEYVKEWTDRKNKKQTEDCSVPYEYEKIFKVPDAEEIASRLEHSEVTPGSSKQAREELDDDDWDEEEDSDTPWDEEEDEEEEETPRRRKKKTKKKASKKKKARRRARDEEEDEEEEEDEDEEEFDDEDEDEEDEEDEEEYEDEDEDEEEDDEEEEEEERPRRRAKKRGKKKRSATRRRR